MSGKGGPVKHGAGLWLRRGVLPAGKRHITRAVDAILAEYQQDLGGDLMAGQKIIMQLIRRRLVWLCAIDEWADTQPQVVNDKGQLLGPLGLNYLAYSNAVQRGCETLGLKRVSIADNLEAYLAKKAAGSPVEAQTIQGKPPRQGKARKARCAQAGGEE